MKEILSKISAFFKIEKLKNDKRVIVFSVCILIATTLWFLNALNKDYTTTISYPVKYINPPVNRFLANTPPDRLELKVNAHGFTLLRHKLNFSFSPIILNIRNISRNIQPTSNGFWISTNNLIRRISDQISSEITITSILPNEFFIKLDSLKTKSVPIKPAISYTFKPQFNIKSALTISPEQVEITGPGAILDTLSYLFTETKKFENIDADIIRSIKIIHPENTSIKPEKVELKIPVEKFTEKEINIPIQIQNLPQAVKLKLFPSEIKLTVLVGLSEFEEIDASRFKVRADYNNIKKGSESLTVTIDSKPLNVQIIRFVPAEVEFLIETN